MNAKYVFILTQVYIALCFMWALSSADHRRDPYDMNDYRNHPCKRTCISGEPPMVCKYYFLVEHYTTMSAACYDCPNRESHCFLPQCVTGNGLGRPVLAVNRMVPGPAIHVCEGDTIEVTVDNRMELSEGTTIHWHGINQRGTPYMDGTSMVTQCPISKWSKMTYRFLAELSGTYFWHSHAALQRSDGLFGGLVIRQPQNVDHQGSLYDHDLPEHTIMINDWGETSSVNGILNMFYKRKAAQPSGILVNGKGQAKNGINIPYEEFLVQPGQRYRFRIIYSGVLNCPVYVRVDDHKLLMIASDANDFQPVEVDSFTIYSGERYDFILHTKEKNDLNNTSFWIHFKGFISCALGETIQAAILRYDVGDHSRPKGDVIYSETVPLENETTLNDRSGISSESNIQIVDLKSLDDSEDPDLVDEPDVKHYIAIARSTQPDERFQAPLNPDCRNTTLSSQEHSSNMTNEDNLKIDPCNPTQRHNLQLNYITGRLPPAPPLTQYEDIPRKLMCNGDNIHRDCMREQCDCVHTLVFNKDDLVELVLVNSIGIGSVGQAKEQIIHPIHIHGHAARVVSMLRLNGPNVSFEGVKEMDARGEIPRLASQAPFKDTIPVGDQSVVIVRFRADNPGFWFFHCHIELHTELGMALILQVGHVSEMPRPEKALPKCETWSLYNEDGDMKSVRQHTQTDGALGVITESKENSTEATVSASGYTTLLVIVVGVVCSTVSPIVVVCFMSWLNSKKAKILEASRYKLLSASSAPNDASCYESVSESYSKL